MKTVKELVEDIKRHTILLCLWVVALAFLMSLTSPSVWVNIPIAFLLIACARSLSGEVQIRWKAGQIPSASAPRFTTPRYRRRVRRDSPQGSDVRVLELWRLGINAPEVEAALDDFTKAIVKEFVTGLWFRALSPDQDFPDELANLINNAFAELSTRVKRINLITLITKDIVDLLAGHLQLFRRTQARVGADVMGIASSEDRDENIKQALVASGELHPAVVSADSEYKVLHKLMGGVMSLLLKPEDGNCRVLKYLSRELLACAVMKPVMNLFTPAFINTMIENAAAKSKLAENSKAEVSKAEASKAEASKAEASKADGSKADGSRATKGEGSKSDGSRASKGEGSKADGSRADVSRSDGSKTDGTKGDGLKGDGPKADALKGDGLKADGSKVDSSKADGSKGDATKISAAKKRTPDRPPLGKDSPTTQTGPETSSAIQTKGGQEDFSARGAAKPSQSEGSLVRFGSGDVYGKGGKSESATPALSVDGHPDGPSGQRKVQGKESKENWAQLLEAVNQRKTMALAPEHLDNLWTKGRNYKKREGSKPGGKPTEVGGGTTKEQPASNPPPAKEIPIPSAKPASNPSPAKEIPIPSVKVASSPPPAKEIPIPSAKPKLEGIPRRNELVDFKHVPPSTQTSIESSTFGSEVDLSTEQVNAPSLIDDDRRQRMMRRSRSIGADLDGWHAFTNAGEGIPSLLKPGDEVGLGPGFDLDLAIRKRANQSNREGNNNADLSNMLCNHLQVDVVGAHFEKSGNKTFAVYSVFVTDLQNHTWEVQRRFRNFEQLHRALKEKPYYNLSLPAKRFLSSNLDNSFIRQRCALLDRYLKDLLAIPSIAEVYEVWDFLSANSQTYAFAESPSMFNILSSNVDDAVDDMFRQFRGPNEGKPASSSAASVDEIRKQVMMGGSKAPAPSKDHLSILNESSSGSRQQAAPEKSGSRNLWDEEQDPSLAVTPQLQWLPDDDLQQPFGPEAGLLDTRTFEARAGRALSEGNSPVGSLAGSELPEDDALAVPPDWGPPKVSVPLLNLVDVIFELQGRGWIRRQVFWMAKQVLQIGMGDAIDDFLLGKIQQLRKEEVVAGGVKLLQKILWPDGIFLTKHPSRLANLKKEGSFEQRLEAARRAGIVREIILDRAPAALVSLIGRKQYQLCATDLFFFLQSGVCIKQFIYCLLEQLLVSTFPELEDVILEVRSM